MKGYSLLLPYHHDYHCLSETLLKLVSLTPAPKQLDLLEAIPTGSARFYR